MLISVGPLFLDTDKKLLFDTSHSLLSDNQRLLNVFTLLVNASPDVVSRKQIVELLWPDEQVSDWAVSRVIADLRGLLAQADSDDMIKTIHGKGFRLLAEVSELDVVAVQDKDATEVRVENTRTRWIYVVAIFILLNAIIYVLLKKPSSENTLSVTDPSVYTSGFEDQSLIDYSAIAIRPTRKKKRELPLDSGWWASDKNGLRYSEQGVTYQSGGKIATTVAYDYHGPDFLHGATLVMRVSVDQEYIDTNKGIHLIAHEIGGQWLLHQCYFENLSTEPQAYECLLDAPGMVFNISDDEYLIFGVTGENDYSKGRVTVHSIEIEYPPSVSVHSDWYTIPVRPMGYEGGVFIQTSNRSQNLSATLAGPLKLQNATLAFTFEASQEYIDSGADIQPYAQRVGENWDGEWNCWISNTDILPGGMTAHCGLLEAHTIFNIEQGQYLEVGLRTYGLKVAGEIKITGLTISCADEYPDCGIQ